jgi:hypothetical protein
MYGKLTWQPWRVQGETSQIAEKAQLAGDFTVLGLIAQLKGPPTRDGYQVATVFVDHASDYTYVHFQTSDTSVETVQAKQEFERHAAGGRFVDTCG